MKTKIFVICATLASLGDFAHAQEAELPTDQIVCQYARLRERAPFPSLDPTQLAAATETEPNNSIAAAQSIPLGFGGGLEVDVDITGAISPFDQDFFVVQARRGQILGIAVLAIDINELDSNVSIVASNGAILAKNEDHQIGSSKVGDLYPPESPMPAGGLRRDSILAFVFPADGTYFVRVAGLNAASGGYLAQFRLREPTLVAEPVGTKQIIFLDFDGATVNAQTLFGSGGNPSANLTPFVSFLPAWGLPASKENALIDAIIASVRDHFELLLDSERPNVDLEIRNSRDHADDFGSNPYVSRIVIGGTINELGIGTIGIAECIDPGNFSHDDTAVVLLDLLSAQPSNPNSINGLPRIAAMTLDDAIARVIAAVACHEAGHFLGCWHTENTNVPSATMDRGGSLTNTAGVGPNGVLEPADPLNRFVADFYANEGVVLTTLRQNTNHRVLNALSIGRAPTPSPSENSTQALMAALQERVEELSTPTAGTVSTTLESLGLEEIPLAEIKDDRLLKALRDTSSKADFLSRETAEAEIRAD
jgi:hypothetical protein